MELSRLLASHLKSWGTELDTTRQFSCQALRFSALTEKYGHHRPEGCPNALSRLQVC